MLDLMMLGRLELAISDGVDLAAVAREAIVHGASDETPVRLRAQEGVVGARGARLGGERGGGAGRGSESRELKPRSSGGVPNPCPESFPLSLGGRRRWRELGLYMPDEPAALVWFRRDLRAYDHAALHAALRASRTVHCAFVFDTDILGALPSRADRRVDFIWQSVRELGERLAGMGGGLHVLHGSAREEIPRIARRLGVDSVYANRDYEPRAVARDAEVEAKLRAAGKAFHTSKDQVIFEADEVLTRAGTPFAVFTPYERAWRAKLDERCVRPYAIEKHAAGLAASGSPLPSLAAIGFEPAPMALPAGTSGAKKLFADFKRRIDDYARTRDYPALKGTSLLSVHLRFGTLSIRELVGYAFRREGEGAAAWLSELVWRDFFFAVLSVRPDVVDHAYKREYDALVFDDDEALWRAWCEGRTGYPLVDAAMRQLNATGYMHNRLRMLTASFLVKDLGIDWRRGERYFAEKLNDYDLAANNGGWQWAASTGCDAQPWFRIFNPVAQSRKFDARGKFIRTYLPELAGLTDDEVHEPRSPVVDHAEARKSTIARYAAVRRPRRGPARRRASRPSRGLARPVDASRRASARPSAGGGSRRA